MENLEQIDFAPDIWLLRVTDLKQYEYCPRVVFYEYCLPGVRPVGRAVPPGQVPGTPVVKVNTAETAPSPQ